MHDAKEDVIRILLRVKKREELLGQLDDELLSCTELRAKGYYFVLLKLSCKLFNLMEALKVNHPMMNRPFMYKEKQMQPTLIRDTLELRSKLIRKFRSLKKQLDRVLDKSGHIVRVDVLTTLNRRNDGEIGDIHGDSSSLLQIPSF